MRERKSKQLRRLAQSHTHIPVIETTGGIRFSAGDVDDNTHARLICRVCGKKIRHQHHVTAIYPTAF